MTITIVSGPPWVSLGADGKLTGQAPAPGTYSVVLQSVVGADIATATVNLVAASLAAVSTVQTATLLDLARLSLSFSAAVSGDLAQALGLQLSFSAQYSPTATLPFTLSFSAVANAGPLIPNPGDPDYNEPNNVSSQATVLTNGQISYNTMPAGDSQDWFKLTKTNTSAITFTFSNMTQLPTDLVEGIYIDVYALANDAASLWDGYTDSSSLVVTTSSFSPGTYLVRLVYAGDPYQSYNFVPSW